MLRAWFAAVAALALAMTLIAASCDKDIQLGVDPDSAVTAAADAGAES